MLYTPEYKQEMEKIMNAFGDYIREQESWDIIYSEKIGYIRIQIYKSQVEDALWLATPKKLMYIIFREMIHDVVFSSKKPTRGYDDSVLTEYEETESRRRITAILATMDDESRTRYLPLLDKCIKEY